MHWEILFGLKNSVTTGVISATNRTISLKNRVLFNDFLQTDAAINPGNSGGALLNIHGRLIGINTAIHFKGQGLGFAIPSKRIRKTIGQLLDYRRLKKIWIGLKLREIHQNRLDWSVKVREVVSGSPAHKAGIRHGDLLKSIDGIPVHCLFDFRKKMYLKRQKDIVNLKLKRGKRIYSVYIKTESVPITPQQKMLWRRLGVLAYDTKKGVTVEKIRLGSSAYRIGIRKDDIIMGLGEYAIRSVRELNFLVRQLDSKEVVSIVLMRRNRRLGGSIILE